MATKIARASVYVRKITGKWYVETHWMGKRKAQQMEGLKEANAYRRFLKRQMREGKFSFPIESKPDIQDQRISFHDFYTKIFQPNHVQNLSEAAQADYKNSFNRYLTPAFGKIPLTEVSPAMVDDFLSGLVTIGKSKNTIRVIVSNARKMYNHAMKREEVTRNPFSRMGESFKNAQGRKEIDYLHFDEVPVFMEALKEHFPNYYDFFAVAIYAGLREGELKGLQFGDLQLGDEKTLTLSPYMKIQRSVTQTGSVKGTKTDKPRTVSINNELFVLLSTRRTRMLAEWKASGLDESEFPDSFVFPNETGKPLDGSNVKKRVFRPALLKAGLRTINFHALRHTFASLLLQKGVPLAHISKWLGHSKINITCDIYGHLEVTTNREALNLLPSMTATVEEKKVITISSKK